jgi:hypothetical protein
MRKKLLITQKVLMMILNPQGDMIVRGSGWPEDVRLVDAKVDHFTMSEDPQGSILELLLESDNFDPDGRYVWGDNFSPEFSTQITCSECGKLFVRRLDEGTDGSQ